MSVCLFGPKETPTAGARRVDTVTQELKLSKRHGGFLRIHTAAPAMSALPQWDTLVTGNEQIPSCCY